MRIAQVAPLFEAVPPIGYGGTERVVSHLTEALVRQGHDVTLYASGDSRTSAKLVPITERALRGTSDWPDPAMPHVLAMERVAADADQFDVIHFHVDTLSLPYARRIATPSLLTLHGRLDLPGLPAFFSEFHDDTRLVSISNDQRRPLPTLPWLATVYHGIDVDLFPFVPEPKGDYLVFVGRISPEKRPDHAIEIARRAGMKLKIAAKVDAADREYFATTIAPLLTEPHVEFIGEVGDGDKGELLGNARALLFPIDWPEPFGLIMIEAMATGTPVIATRRGSVPEVVDHGVTGLIVDDVDGAVGAVEEVGTLDRAAVRRRFEERFSADRMASDYVRAYEMLLEERGRLPKPMPVVPAPRPVAVRPPAGRSVQANGFVTHRSSAAVSGTAAFERRARMAVAGSGEPVRPDGRS